MSAFVSFGPDPSKESVVLLHGFSGTPWDWQGTAQELADAAAYALPGHHPSVPPAASFEAAVDGLLERLPAHPVVLIGYSLGGRLALGMVAAAPERFHGLALVAAHTGLDDEVARAARRDRDASLAALLRESPATFFRRWDGQELFQNHKRTPALDAWQARREALDPEALADALTTLSPGTMPSFASVLADLRMPLCLVAGAHDGRYRQHYAALSGLRPDVPVHIIPDAAHRILIDAPEALGIVLQSFVDNTAGTDIRPPGEEG
ncbi:MAG: alpha/beta fold hydrolase [Myxococcota bacterium]